MFFLAVFLGPHFSYFFKTLCQKKEFWDPYGSQLGPKWHPKSAKWRQSGTLFSKVRSLVRVPAPDWLPT